MGMKQYDEDEATPPVPTTPVVPTVQTTPVSLPVELNQGAAPAAPTN